MTWVPLSKSTLSHNVCIHENNDSHDKTKNSVFSLTNLQILDNKSCKSKSSELFMADIIIGGRSCNALCKIVFPKGISCKTEQKAWAPRIRVCKLFVSDKNGIMMLKTKSILFNSTVPIFSANLSSKNNARSWCL